MKSILGNMKNKSHSKISGYIGHFNLEEWWLNELNVDERNRILKKIQTDG